MASSDAVSFSCGRSRKSIFCPHCDENVGHSTYYRHRAQFFDFRTDQWMKASRGDSPSLNDSTSSDDDREQFFTRALNQPKPLGDYENSSSQTGTVYFTYIYYDKQFTKSEQYGHYHLMYSIIIIYRYYSYYR